jgi:heme-degrading monooxygenase HmoA
MASEVTQYGLEENIPSDQLNYMWLSEDPINKQESVMYARRVSLSLKPNSAAEFTQKLEKEVIPMLRKQKGFQDEITFVVPAGTEAFGVSLWDNKENAEAYNRGPYAEVTKMLAKMVEGTPRVDTYEVSNSTFHKIHAGATA